MIKSISMVTDDGENKGTQANMWLNRLCVYIVRVDRFDDACEVQNVLRNGETCWTLTIGPDCTYFTLHSLFVVLCLVPVPLPKSAVWSDWPAGPVCFDRSTASSVFRECLVPYHNREFQHTTNATHIIVMWIRRRKLKI